MTVIYLDMDGVLANFDKKCLELMGKLPRDFSSSQEGWDALMHHKFTIYSALEPMPDAEELVSGVYKFAKKYKYSVGVLTAIPKMNRVPKAQQQKQAWLKKYFPKLLKDFNIGPYAVDKQWHCNHGDVLIDDSELNIPQWTQRGGYGILHTSATQSLMLLEDYLII